MLSPVRLIIV